MKLQNLKTCFLNCKFLILVWFYFYFVTCDVKLAQYLSYIFKRGGTITVWVSLYSFIRQTTTTDGAMNSVFYPWIQKENFWSISSSHVKAFVFSSNGRPISLSSSECSKPWNNKAFGVALVNCFKLLWPCLKRPCREPFQCRIWNHFCREKLEKLLLSNVAQPVTLGNNWGWATFSL